MTHKLRYLLIIVSLMFTVVICSAQHISFLGIPIDGSLSSFQNKLANKGFRYNQTESRLAPSGKRIFSGTWKAWPRRFRSRGRYRNPRIRRG